MVKDLSFRRLEQEIDAMLIEKSFVEKNHFALKEQVAKALKEYFKGVLLFVNIKNGNISLVITSGKKYGKAKFVYIPVELETEDSKVGSGFGRTYVKHSLRLDLRNLNKIYFTKDRDIDTLGELIDVVFDEAKKDYEKTIDGAQEIADLLKEHNMTPQTYRNIIYKTDQLKKTDEEWYNTIKDKLR